MTAYEVTVETPADADHERAGETLRLTVRAEEYVLAAARRQDAWLPADCQQGWCTTCAARLLDGTVDQSDAVRYYDEDADAGLILTCRAKPLSDLHVRACQEAAMLDHRAENDLPPGSAKR